MAMSAARRKMSLLSSSIVGPKEEAHVESFQVPFDKFTREQLQDYRDLFCYFDDDGNGVISYEEMEQAMRKLGFDPTSDQINQLIAQIDTNQNGEIEFSEFCEAMYTLIEMKDHDKVIQECFDVFDKDRSGAVSEDEFVRVCKEIGNLPVKMSKRVFHESSVLGGGFLTFDEFAQMARHYLFDDETSSY